MKLTSRTLALPLAFGLLLITTSVALAWPDDPFSQVQISGPGIDDVAIIQGADLGGMTIESFTDFNEIAAPLQLGAAYELHRYFQHGDGREWDFDRVIYYFDPAGGAGYVYYAEGIGYSPAWNTGKWFRAGPSASQIMRGMLEPLGAWPAAMAATNGTAERATAALPALPPLTAYAVGAIALLGAVGALLYTRLRRYTLSP